MDNVRQKRSVAEIPLVCDRVSVVTPPVLDQVVPRHRGVYAAVAGRGLRDGLCRAAGQAHLRVLPTFKVTPVGHDQRRSLLPCPGIRHGGRDREGDRQDSARRYSSSNLKPPNIMTSGPPRSPPNRGKPSSPDKPTNIRTYGRSRPHRKRRRSIAIVVPRNLRK